MKKPETQYISFTADARLLSELGERLVASEYVAVAELLKNSYDADATVVQVTLSAGRDSLTILDDGHGISAAEFRALWMSIAGSEKQAAKVSRKYGRPLAGSKGVGRFAVRRLGRQLTLVSVTQNGRAREKLTAQFDWKMFQKPGALTSVKIPYSIQTNVTEAVGTTLLISELLDKWDAPRVAKVAGKVLDIVSPSIFADLVRVRGTEDPGFRVAFGSDEDGDLKDIGEEILERYVGRVSFAVSDKRVACVCEFDGLEPERINIKLKENLIGDVKGEIRYFPRRAGVFRDIQGVDGRMARSWLTENSGVRVYDRGFRMLPYGEGGDDWLRLSQWKAERRREWGSSLTEIYQPKATRDKEEAQDPLLKIPHDRQLIGAVRVSSLHAPPSSRLDSSSAGLYPAMDRQGFVENAGFFQLRDIVRGAVEILAVLDVRATAQKTKKAAKEKASLLRKELRAAKKFAETAPNVPASVRRSMVEQYSRMLDQVDDYEHATREAQDAIETLSLLGVLSSFMTHETTVMLRAIEDAIAALQRPLRDGVREQAAKVLVAARDSLRSHLDYAETFIHGVRSARIVRFRVRGQIVRLVEMLSAFTRDRGIEVVVDVASTQTSPGVTVAVYSGIVLNLLTNAIKAVMQATRQPRKVAVRVQIEGGFHCLQVSDTGIGIPDSLQERIFDPLFSTTAEEGPLGTGLGLGLYIAKRVIQNTGGMISVIRPAPDYNTCIEVQWPA